MEWLVAVLVGAVVLMAVLVCAGAAIVLRRSADSESLRFDSMIRLVEDSHEKVMSSSDGYLDLKRIGADLEPVRNRRMKEPEPPAGGMNLEIREPNLDGSIN